MKNLGELLAMAREKPDSLSYGMSGTGTSAHLAGELFNFMAKVKIQSIPYKGGAPALTAGIAGDIPMSINPLPEVVGQLEGGAVRAIAVTTASRSKALPDVPTVAESGLPARPFRRLRPENSLCLPTANGQFGRGKGAVG